MMVIGCCRCMRMMRVDGQPLGEKISHGGVMNVQEMLGHFAGIDGNPSVASFADRATAETEAKKHGWQADDGDHRCPECIQIELAAKDARSPYAGMIERRGFCIEWPFLQRQTEGQPMNAGGKEK